MLMRGVYEFLGDFRIESRQADVEAGRQAQMAARHYG